MSGREDWYGVPKEDWTPFIWNPSNCISQNVFLQLLMKYKYKYWIQSLYSVIPKSCSGGVLKNKHFSRPVLKVMFKVRDFLFLFMLCKHKDKIIGSPNWEVLSKYFETLVSYFFSRNMLYMSSPSFLVFQIPFCDSLKWRCSRSTFHRFSNASLREMEKCFLSLTNHKRRKSSYMKGCHTLFMWILSLACLGSDTFCQPFIRSSCRCLS